MDRPGLAGLHAGGQLHWLRLQVAGRVQSAAGEERRQRERRELLQEDRGRGAEGPVAKGNPQADQDVRRQARQRGQRSRRGRGLHRQALRRRGGVQHEGLAEQEQRPPAAGVRGPHLRLGAVPRAVARGGGPGQGPLPLHQQEVRAGPGVPPHDARHLQPPLHPLLQAQRGAEAEHLQGQAGPRAARAVRHHRARQDHARRLPEPLQLRGDDDALQGPPAGEVPALRHAHLHRGFDARLRRAARGVGPGHVAPFPEGRPDEGARRHALLGGEAGCGQAVPDSERHYPQEVGPRHPRGAALQLRPQAYHADAGGACLEGAVPGGRGHFSPAASHRGCQAARQGAQAGRSPPPRRRLPRRPPCSGPVEQDSPAAQGALGHGPVPGLLPADAPQAVGCRSSGARRRG
mmetsp:Transcript_9474/g.25419  ORF Transcript_9474/g.25419 Transcript_9474/m.25419 type:complete len:404 (+) Transcript_9474:1567-2778(+)